MPRCGTHGEGLPENGDISGRCAGPIRSHFWCSLDERKALSLKGLRLKSEVDSEKLKWHFLAGSRIVGGGCFCGAMETIVAFVKCHVLALTEGRMRNGEEIWSTRELAISRLNATDFGSIGRRQHGHASVGCFTRPRGRISSPVCYVMNQGRFFFAVGLATSRTSA